MKYCRINLRETSYTPSLVWKEIHIPDIDHLNSIYRKYCEYKNFESVVPIFDKQYFDNIIIGYYDNEELVAFSIIARYDSKNVECVQFAWDYEKPHLKMGIESLKTECAIFKERGYDYLYLGIADPYKKIDGYEELGKL